MSRFTAFLSLTLLFVLLCSSANSQTAYSDWSAHKIVYGDVGFNSAPARIRYPFTGQVGHLKLRNNFNPFVGIGYAHKWFNLRLNFNLKNTERAVSRFGKTRAFNLGLDFQAKRSFFEMGFNYYKGFAIKNAYLFDSTLNELKPNIIKPNMASANVYLSAFIFQNEQWKMKAYKGKSASFNQTTESFYFNPNLCVYGISNDNSRLLPTILQDSVESITLNKGMSAIEFSFLPGYARIWVFGPWKMGGLFGIGPAMQAKSYALDNLSRSFLGLAIRSDWRLIVSYNQPKFFITGESDFNNKSIRFTNFRFRQVYYNFRFTFGYRFESKKEK